MRQTLTILFFIPILALGQTLFISTTKTNVLYVGVDNPLKVYECNIPCEKISLKTLSTGIKISGKNGEFNIKPEFPERAAIFQVINNTDSSVIDTFNIKVKLLPDPDIKFHISVTGLLRTDSIIVNSEVWDNLGLKYKIVKFELIAKRDTTQLFTIENMSKFYNEQTIKKVNQLHLGDLLGIGIVWIELEGFTSTYNASMWYKLK